MLSEPKDRTCIRSSYRAQLLEFKQSGKSPKDADEMENNVAVWSGSMLFAQTCLSKNLGSLQYIMEMEYQYVMRGSGVKSQ